MRTIPDLSFTKEQKRELLLAWGFTFEKIIREFRQSVYHNDVETWEREKEGPFKDGKPYLEPSIGYGEYSDDEWLDKVFCVELAARLIPFLKTLDAIRNQTTLHNI